MTDKTMSCNNVQLFVTKKDAILRHPSFGKQNCICVSWIHVCKLLLCSLKLLQCDKKILLCMLGVMQPLQSEGHCPGHSKGLMCLVHPCALCYVRQKIQFIKCFRIFSPNLREKMIYPCSCALWVLLYKAHRGEHWNFELCEVNSQEQNEHSQWKIGNLYFMRLNLLEGIFKVTYKTSEFWAQVWML